MFIVMIFVFIVILFVSGTDYEDVKDFIDDVKDFMNKED